MRAFLAVLAAAAGLFSLGAALPAAAPAFSDGAQAFVFDKPDPYPGIRMLEVQGVASGQVTGTLTSDWYGTIALLHPRLDADRRSLTFETRNLNDDKQPNRSWTATLDAHGDLKLDGGIWYAHIVQTGHLAAAGEVASLRFKPSALPPFRALASDGLAQTPPMGWSSWNKFADHIDDRTIRAMADAMVTSGLRDAGYQYVNIDDGWQGKRAADGSIRPNANFPDMKVLADYVHSRGLKLGIYSSPGPRTCAGYEGSYGHVEQDARTFAAWGIDYLKYDLCSGEWFYADRDTVQRTYAQMGAALRATGRPIIFSLCEYGRFDVGTWGRTVGGHLWRTTGDITDKYDAMARIGFQDNGKASDAGPGGWNDPDMLEVGNGGMNEDEYRTHMTLWAMSAAPLLMGHDLRQTSPEALRLLTNRGVVAIDQDREGRQATPVRKVGDTEIWVKRLANDDMAIALLNRSASAATIAFMPADAGLAHFTRLHEVWPDQDVPPWTSSRTVPPHGAVLFRASGPLA